MPTALRGAGWRSDRPREKAQEIDGSKDKLRQERSVIDVIAGITPRDNDRRKIEENNFNGGKLQGELGGNGENAKTDVQHQSNEKRQNDSQEQTNINANAEKETVPHPLKASERASAEKGIDCERKETKPSSRNEPSSGRGVGYCRKVLGVKDGKSLPRVPHYGPYGNLLPESYKMPWKQDMKNRAAILANVKSAGKEKLPNIEHNDFLFLRQREQLSPNVEKKEQVEKKVTMPSIDEIIKPAFHHHTIKTKDSQRKAIFPAAPAMHFHHPRLRHVTECYACVPDHDD